MQLLVIMQLFGAPGRIRQARRDVGPAGRHVGDENTLPVSVTTTPAQ
jgi:hypothetical protein